MGTKKMMTHILSKLYEPYYNILGNIQDKLYYEKYLINIESICNKISEKYYQMRVQSETKNPREDENSFKWNPIHGYLYDLW